MDYRTLGGSGCAVSSLALGTMTFGAETGAPEAHRMLDRFLEAGGTLVDTADTYGEGWSNFLNAAFLWDEPLDVAAGEALRVRHRVIVHDGRWDTDRLQAAWAAWAGG